MIYFIVVFCIELCVKPSCRHLFPHFIPSPNTLHACTLVDKLKYSYSFGGYSSYFNVFFLKGKDSVSIFNPPLNNKILWLSSQPVTALLVILILPYFLLHTYRFLYELLFYMVNTCLNLFTVFLTDYPFLHLRPSLWDNFFLPVVHPLEFPLVTVFWWKIQFFTWRYL